MEVKYNMEVNKIYCGDALKIMQAFPDESIDMCMTSPPYWGLRDYGIEQIFGGNKDCEHEWGEKIIRRTFGNVGKHPNVGNQKRDVMKGHENKGQFCSCEAWKGQLGLEPTPELYIEHLTKIFNEVKRVLKKEGTLWLNIGDTYGGSGKGSGDDKPDPKFKGGGRERTLKADKATISKCLQMIPERLALSLIDIGFVLRNKIIWHKPNPMPSSVKDRFSNTWEYLFMFSKSQKYYFDLDAVREAVVESQFDRPRMGNREGKDTIYKSKDERKGLNIPGQSPHGIHRKRHSGYCGANGEYLVNPLGKNPGDFFDVCTQPFPEAHFAVFPEGLCIKPIKAGCPEEACKKCGKARERIIERRAGFDEDGNCFQCGEPKSKHHQGKKSMMKSMDKNGFIPCGLDKTIGFTSCDCKAGFEGGIVLDPFCGAGTTCLVAQKLRRRYIGIDIKEEYCKMSRKRLSQKSLFI